MVEYNAEQYQQPWDSGVNSASSNAQWALTLSSYSLKKNAKIRELDELLHSIAPVEGSVLELGCERGVIGHWLRNQLSECRFNHADLPGPLLQTARTLLPTNEVSEWKSGDKLPFVDQSQDMVLLLDLLEHVDDDEQLAGEAWRVLRPGGLLAVSVPRVRFGQRWRKLADGWGLTKESFGHVREGYSDSDLHGMLRRAGISEKNSMMPVPLHPFCGPTVEGIETILNAGWAKKNSKSKVEREVQHTASNEKSFQKISGLWLAFRMVYPLIWVVSKLDLLLPKDWGYCSIGVWKKST